MSSANLDLVRALCPAWQRGDFSSAEWAHAEIERVLPDGVQPGSSTGVAGMAQGWREFVTAWEEYRLDVEEYRDLDSERVLVLYQRRGRGKASGMELGQLRTKGATLFHVRGGKVTRLVSYADPERALADVGLAPESDVGGS